MNISEINSRQNLQRLYDAYRDSLVIFVKGYVLRNDVAQDLVQEAFIRLWEHEPVFPSESAVRTYLFTSVRNLSLDYLKHQNVENNYVEHYLEESSLLPDAAAEEAFDKEVMELLFRQIERLPNRCREIFLLSLDGCTAGEIAVRLGISVETVRTQKKRAMKMLRSYFNTRMQEKKQKISFIFIFFKLLYPI